MIRAFALVLLVGCGEEDPTGGGDSGLADTACDDAPAATWDSFGRGFLTQHCDVCHAATSPDRHEAPDDVTFDTEDDVRTWRDDILAQATGDTPAMPPTGGVSEDDRYLLETWLTCGL